MTRCIGGLKFLLTITLCFLSCDVNRERIYGDAIKKAPKYLPKKSVAFNGVPVEGCTLANQDGTSRALPITQRYLAWPNMATKSEATIPKLAPAPTTLLAQFQPICLKAPENDTFSDICGSIQEFQIIREQINGCSTYKILTCHIVVSKHYI